MTTSPSARAAALPVRRCGLALAALCSSALFPSCNAGLAGLFASASSDDGGSPPSIGGFVVQGPEQSPATLRFVLVDADGDAANVRFFLRVAGGEPEPLTALVGATNPQSFAGSPEGTEHTVAWSFADEPALTPGGTFQDDVLVWASLAGATATVEGVNASTTGLGNDAPAVVAIDAPQAETAGVVPVGFTLSDSSSDLVSVRVEYAFEGSGTWQLARPAGQDATPALAFVDVTAASGGVELDFFWDTGHDLPQLERDVRLRFTPIDPLVEGVAVVSDPFRVDNNEEAIAVLDSGVVVADDSDRTGGIAIPFRVRDAESDDVRMVFQWREGGQGFPALPTDDPPAVFAIQDDPELRAQYQVCSLRESFFSGRPEVVDATHVRLPELGTAAVTISASRLVGRELELLRAAERPAVLADGWSATPLSAPVAAAPIGDGLETWVLDAPSVQTWRVQRIELASGAVLETLAQGEGVPTALALEPLRNELFVASTAGATWSIARIDAADGTTRATAGGAFVRAGGVRGLAALAGARVAFTVDDELRVAAFGFDPPRVAPVVGGLATPVGVAADPLDRDVVLVAEQGADRVVAVSLSRRAVRDALLPDPDGGPTTTGLPAPRAVALDQGGRRLVALCEAEPGEPELRALNRRSPHDLDASGFADPLAYVLCALPAGVGPALGIGPDGLRVLPLGDGLVAVGGVEQRRSIAAAVPTSNVVTLGAPLAPAASAATRWRVLRASNLFGTTPEGVAAVFPWDTRDLWRGGEVLLRALPFDTELGIDAATSLPRAADSELGTRRLVVDANADGGVAVPALVDYDRDGDLDVLVSEGADTRIVPQTAPGVFAAPVVPDVPLTDSLGVPLVLDDLDADGVPDLVHVRASFALDVYRGLGPASFDPTPQVLAMPVDTSLDLMPLVHVEPSDVDADGDVDLVVTVPMSDEGQQPDETAGTNNVVLVYLQDARATFGAAPLVLGGPGVTDVPRHVAVGDVDGDGLVDFAAADDGFRVVFDEVVVTGDTGRISLHFQDSPGAFDPVPVVLGDIQELFEGVLTYSTASVRCVALADVDGDGDLDVVAAHGEPFAFPGELAPTLSRSVSVFWQTAPRVFDPQPLVLRGPPVSLGAFVPLESVDAADVDGDGDLDVVAHGAQHVLVFQALGQGAFDPDPLVLLNATQAADPLAPIPTHPLLAADVDGDGDIDLVHRDWGTDEIVLRPQTTHDLETLSGVPTRFAEAGLTDGMVDVALANFDSDGPPDLATANGSFLGAFGTKDYQIRIQASPRNFVADPLSLGDALPTLLPARVGAADLDGDGDHDLVGVDTGLDQVQVFVQEPGGAFAAPFGLDGVHDEATAPNPFFDSLAPELVCDLDRDGDLDVVAAANLFESVVCYEQTAPGVFVQAFVLENDPDQLLASEPRGLAAADFDADGDLDLALVTSEVGGRLVIFDGRGPMQLKATATTVLAGFGVVLADDVDGDGDVDLVTGSGFPPFAASTTLHLRADDGSWTPVPVGLAAQGPGLTTSSHTMRLVDVDRDGDLDLVALAGGSPLLGGGSAVVAEQIAPALFAPPRVLAPGGSSILCDDVDGDGELDLAITVFSFAGARLDVFWGNE